MEITNELIEKLATLSKLEFEGEQKEKVKNDLQKMLNFVDKLQEINTTGVEPLIFMTDESNKLREDIAIETISQKEALENAPIKDSDYFRVPKVLDK